MPRLLGAALSRAGSLGVRRPWRSLACVVALSGLAVFGVRQLQLDADLTRLLPESFSSVQDLRTLEKRAGASGYIVVAVQGGTVETRRAYAKAVAKPLAALDSIEFVDVERPVDWFVDRALYFLDLQDLKLVQQRIDARAAWERQRHNPMYIDLEESEPPSLDFEDIQRKYQRGSATWLTRQQQRYYEGDGILAVFARPARRSTDLNVTSNMVAEAQQVLDDLQPATFHPEMTALLTGRFQKRLDQKRQMSRDLSTASLLALALTVLYLLLHFRSLQALTLVVVPLLTGLLWTFGIAGATFGSLNILTAFIGAILLGLGVDHGIHLVSGWRAQRARGHESDHALERTFAETGRSVVVASVTTIAAFVGVGLSDFRAFHEFGLLAACGMACVVVAYVLLLPALIALLPDDGPPVATPTDGSPILRAQHRWPHRALVIGLLATVLLAVPGGDSTFNYDFAALEDANIPSFVLDKKVNRLLGYSQTPTLVLAGSAGQSRAVADTMRRIAGLPGSTIDMVATLADLVPSRQSEKRLVIRRIARSVKKVKPTWLKNPDHREARGRLLRAARLPPFSQSDLPHSVRRQFGDAGGGTYVLGFPSISLSDGVRVPEFAREMRSAAATELGTLPTAGEAMVLADILALVQEEGPTILVLTVLLVFIAMWLLLGSLVRASAGLFTALLTLAGTLGVAAMAGVDLNYLNLVMVPVIVGIAVDSAAHFLGGQHRDSASSLDLARAVGGAILTTSIGFGALLIADHPGLRSLGALALLGLAMNTLVSFAILPSLATLLDSRASSDGGAFASN